jgi:GDP-L-fucose synthase
MDKKSTIYIAGHRGLVGSAIYGQLQQSGYENLLTRTSKELDLRNQQATNDFFEKERPEYVFLCAAKVGGIVANSTYRADFIYDNIMIASNVIHAAWKYGVKKLLNLGSSCIYPKYAPQPLREEYLLTGELEQTNEPYAIAKIAAIKLCSNYYQQYGANFMSLMPSNLYGHNDNFNLETSHVVPALIRKIILAKYLQQNDMERLRRDIMLYPFGFGIHPNPDTLSDHGIRHALAEVGIRDNQVTLWGSGTPRRELLHADDMAQAAVYFMDKYSAAETGEFINCGSGNDHTIHELAEMIREAVDWQGEFVFDMSKPDGTPRKLLDISHARQLGWEPRISLQKGIADIVHQYRISTQND